MILYLLGKLRLYFSSYSTIYKRVYRLKKRKIAFIIWTVDLNAPKSIFFNNGFSERIVISLTCLIFPNTTLIRNFNTLLFARVLVFNIDFIYNIHFSSNFISILPNRIAVVSSLALAG
jgi:hypothetical protein